MWVNGFSSFECASLHTPTLPSDQSLVVDHRVPASISTLQRPKALPDARERAWKRSLSVPSDLEDVTICPAAREIDIIRSSSSSPLLKSSPPLNPCGHSSPTPAGSTPPAQSPAPSTDASSGATHGPGATHPGSWAPPKCLAQWSETPRPAVRTTDPERDSTHTHVALLSFFLSSIPRPKAFAGRSGVHVFLFQAGLHDYTCSYGRRQNKEMHHPQRVKQICFMESQDLSSVLWVMQTHKGFSFKQMGSIQTTQANENRHTGG